MLLAVGLIRNHTYRVYSVLTTKRQHLLQSLEYLSHYLRLSVHLSMKIQVYIYTSAKNTKKGNHKEKQEQERKQNKKLSLYIMSIIVGKKGIPNHKQRQVEKVGKEEKNPCWSCGDEV